VFEWAYVNGCPTDDDSDGGNEFIADNVLAEDEVNVGTDLLH
jgi:hypothetical protein